MALNHRRAGGCSSPSISQEKISPTRRPRSGFSPSPFLLFSSLLSSRTIRAAAMQYQFHALTLVPRRQRPGNARSRASAFFLAPLLPRHGPGDRSGRARGIPEMAERVPAKVAERYDKSRGAPCELCSDTTATQTSTDRLSRLRYTAFRERPASGAERRERNRRAARASRPVPRIIVTSH